MRLSRRAVAVLIVAAATFTAAAPVTAAGSEISFNILFDFGDGSYVWARAMSPNPDATNATWDAIRHATDMLKIPIESQWFACCGVGIFDIGGRQSPAGFIGIFLWNRTSHQWEPTSEGVSGLVLREGDQLALYNAAFDSVNFEVRRPAATPDDPRPSVMFRGDASNRGLSASSAPDRADVFWDTDAQVREIGATPAVAYGRIYVNTIEKLLALDAETGAIRWENSEARGFSSPAVFDDSVFVGSSNGSVYRINATDGSVQWATRLLTETGFSGITSSPKIVFDWVFIGTLNETGGTGEVASLWASNGTVRWRHETGSIHFSSPAYAGGTVYVGVMGLYNTTSQITFDPPYGVLALDAATGLERWFFETSGSVAASPAVAGNTLIAPAKDGNLYAVDRHNGAEVWRRALGAGVSSPALSDDTVFVGGGTFGGGGRMAAVDLATGQERWSYVPNGPVQSSVTLASGTILFATNAANGTIYALDAATGGLRWTFVPAPAQYILASPVVADGIVYAASDNGHVYALNDKPSSSGPQRMGTVSLAIAVVVIGAVAAVAAFVLLRRPRRGL